MKKQILSMMERLAWLGRHYETEQGSAEVLGEMIDHLRELPDHPHLRTTRQILVEFKRQREAGDQVDVTGELREAHETLSLYLRTVAGPQTGVGGMERDDPVSSRRYIAEFGGPDVDHFPDR